MVAKQTRRNAWKRFPHFQFPAGRAEIPSKGMNLSPDLLHTLAASLQDRLRDVVPNIRKVRKARLCTVTVAAITF